MKNKDIIKIIKNDCDKVEVPNLTDKILVNFKNESCNSEIEYKTERKFSFNFRSLKIAMTFVLMIFLIPVMLIGFDLLNGGGVEQKDPIQLNVSKTKEIYGVQAASLFGFAEQNTETQTIKTMSLNTDDYEDMSNELNQYLFSIEELMNKGNNRYELFELFDGDYQYKLSIYVDSNGLTSIYNMYFNELTTSEEYNDIDEVSSTIAGYIESGEKKYNVTGTKEVEEDECEVELKLFLNNEDYIVLNQEIEKNESEYSYKYFKGGKKEKEIEISTETLDGEHVVTVDVKHGDKKNGYKIKYNSDTQMNVEYNYGDNYGEFNVDVYEKEYEYSFEDGNKVTHGRPGHSHGGGNWDDEHHYGNGKPDDNHPNHEDLPEQEEGEDDDEHGKGPDREDDDYEHPEHDDDFDDDNKHQDKGGK